VISDEKLRRYYPQFFPEISAEGGEKGSHGSGDGMSEKGGSVGAKRKLDENDGDYESEGECRGQRRQRNL